MSKESDREFVKDVLLDIEPMSLYDLVSLLKDKEEEIARDLGVGINRYISASVEMAHYEPKLVLSVFKSEGGF